MKNFIFFPKRVLFFVATLSTLFIQQKVTASPLIIRLNLMNCYTKLTPQAQQNINYSIESGTWKGSNVCPEIFIEEIEKLTLSQFKTTLEPILLIPVEQQILYNPYEEQHPRILLEQNSLITTIIYILNSITGTFNKNGSIITNIPIGELCLVIFNNGTYEQTRHRPKEIVTKFAKLSLS